MPREPTSPIPDVGSIVGLLIPRAVGAYILFSVTDVFKDTFTDNQVLDVISQVESMGANIFNLLIVLDLVIIVVAMISMVRGQIGGRRPL